MIISEKLLGGIGLKKNKSFYEVYTDGSCSVKNKIGGWAYAIHVHNSIGLNQKYENSGSKRGTTNNEMELYAIIMALKKIEELNHKDYWVVIYSDSEWVINCLTKKNWNCKKHLKMFELIKDYMRRFNIVFKWVKGHDLDEKNNYVDKLANLRMREEVEKYG